jgi:hypothetical protein
VVAATSPDAVDQVVCRLVGDLARGRPRTGPYRPPLPRAVPPLTASTPSAGRPAQQVSEPSHQVGDLFAVQNCVTGSDELWPVGCLRDPHEDATHLDRQGRTSQSAPLVQCRRAPRGVRQDRPVRQAAGWGHIPAWRGRARRDSGTTSTRPKNREAPAPIRPAGPKGDGVRADHVRLTCSGRH